MLNDEDEAIRRSGWMKILEARKTINERDPIRTFKMPTLNFNCSSYRSLIRGGFEHADPPVLRDVEVTDLNIDELTSLQLLDHDFAEFLENMPIHTQAVERCVQMGTAASTKVCGEQRRDGFIANKIASRNTMKQFETKQEFDFTNAIANHLKV